MRELSGIETQIVNGGTVLVSGETVTYNTIFWTSFFEGAGTGAGLICSIPMGATLLVGGALYYGIFTPLYYVGYSLHLVAEGLAHGIVNVVSGAYNAVTQ